MDADPCQSIFRSTGFAGLWKARQAVLPPQVWTQGPQPHHIGAPSPHLRYFPKPSWRWWCLGWPTSTNFSRPWYRKVLDRYITMSFKWRLSLVVCLNYTKSEYSKKHRTNYQFELKFETELELGKRKFVSDFLLDRPWILDLLSLQSFYLNISDYL